jgi:nucleotide-binding universal stress UspA family protein
MAGHTVLIPTDGTAFARQIYPFVIKFLPPTDNTIMLLRVGDPPEGHTGQPARVVSEGSQTLGYESVHDIEESIHPIYASQERDSAEAEFQRALREDVHMLESAGYTVSSHVRFGDPGDAIVAFVKAHEVDMVAITTHWRRGLDRLIYGSVAQHVARYLDIPVMMVHAGEPR